MVLLRGLSRVGRVLGRSSVAAGGAGLAGGVLLDDVPLGSELDPTEGGGSNPIVLVLVGLVLAFAAIVFLDGFLPD